MRTQNFDGWSLLQWTIIVGVTVTIASLVLLWPTQDGTRVEGVGAIINSLTISNGKCVIIVTVNGSDITHTFAKDISFCNKFQRGPATLLEEVRYSKTLLNGMTQQRGLNFSVKQ